MSAFDRRELPVGTGGELEIVGTVTGRFYVKKSAITEIDKSPVVCSTEVMDMTVQDYAGYKASLVQAKSLLTQVERDLRADVMDGVSITREREDELMNLRAEILASLVEIMDITNQMVLNGL